MMKHATGIIWLMPIVLLLLLLAGCEFLEPEDSKITIELQTTTGAPGSVVNFTTSKDIGPDDGITVQVGNQIVALLPAGGPRSFSTVIPLMDAGATDIVLQKNGADYSNSAGFTVTAMQATGVAAGQIAHAVINDQDYIFNALAQDFIPELRYSGQMTVANVNAFSADVLRARNYQNKLRTLVNQLSTAEKIQLDQLFVNSGVWDLTKSMKDATLSTAKELDGMAKDGYFQHYLCLSLDGFSAVLTALDRLVIFAGIAGAIPSGGSLAAIAALASLTIGIIDGGIDAFIPTDLEEIWVEGSQPVITPLGGEAEVVVRGRFTPQTEPVAMSMSLFLSTMLTVAEIPELESYIINTLQSVDIDLSEPMNQMLADWQAVNFIECRVHPALYADGLQAFINCLAAASGIYVPNSSIYEFMAMITGIGYTPANTSIATFNTINSTAHGVQSGTTNFNYNGYRFVPSSGAWLLLGFDYPAVLDQSAIHAASFKVQSAEANTLRLTSTPSEAEIFFNGNETGFFTPITVILPYAGTHEFKLAKSGYNDYVTSISTVDGGVYAIDATLSQSGYPRPLVTINSPADYSNYYDNVITVSGTIRLQDAYGGIFNYTGSDALISVNGNASELNVVGGSFNQDVSISQGDNELYVSVTTDGGITGTSPIRHVTGIFDVAPIETVLTWNTPTSDLDMHVWNPDGEHCYYGHMNISEGSLDIDDVEGYGPETFTTAWVQVGVYYFAVNSYSLDDDAYADASFRLFLNGQETNYGPHRFTTQDYNGDDPASWWNVVTVTVTGKSVTVGGNVPAAMLAKIKEDIRNLPRKK